LDAERRLVEVVNQYRHRRTDHDVRIGRGYSALGNPHEIAPALKGEVRNRRRTEVVALYETWLRAQLEDPTSAASVAFDALPDDAVLVCFCKPAACHGDVIVRLKAELAAQRGFVAAP
jgi:hypothetical protein